MALNSFARRLMAGAALCLLAQAPAFAQSAPETQALLRRLEQAEQRVQTLEQAVYRGQVPQALPVAPGGAVDTVLYDRVQQLEGVLREQTGLIERLQFELRRTQQDLAEVKAAPVATTPPAAALGVPSTAPGLGGAGPDTVTVLPTAGPVSDQTLATGEVEARYEQAYKTLSAGQFGEAQKQFEAFINAYPDHKLTPNAYFWLGESFMGRQLYPDAAKVFAEGYQRFKASSKAAETLLKFGVALARQNRAADACTVFANLAKEYPQAPANVRQVAQRERAAAKCPA